MSEEINLPELAKIIDQFKSIKPIAGDKLNEIQKQHPELNPFAEVELKEKLPVYTNFYLALSHDLTGEKYNQIVLIGERKKLIGPGLVYDILTELHQFEHPIPATPNIEITSPASQGDQAEFDKHVPRFGVSYKLIGVVKIEETKIFIASAKAVYPGAPSYLYVYISYSGGLHPFTSDVKAGGWSNWRRFRSNNSWDFERFLNDILPIPGETYHPICYRTQVVNGLNVEIIGQSTYSGIGSVTSIVIDKLHYDNQGTLVSRNRETLYQTPQYF